MSFLALGLISDADLRQRPDWNDHVIRRFLPKAHAVIRNLNDRSAPPTRPHRVEDVEAIEASIEYKDWQAQWHVHKSRRVRGGQTRTYRPSRR